MSDLSISGKVAKAAAARRALQVGKEGMILDIIGGCGGVQLFTSTEMI